MSNLPPKMNPEDALKDGITPGLVVKAGLDGTPSWLPEGGGAAGTNSYDHHQAIAAAIWSVPHNLGFFPNVSVIDSAGTNIEGGSIEHVNANLLTITFSAPFSGDAHLS